MSGVEMFLLLSFLIVAGVSAEDPPQMHYGEKKNSLCLHSRKKPNKNVVWTFNGKAVVDEGKITAKFPEKAFSYDPQNFSLCISNLTEDDSGTYKLIFLNYDLEHVTEIHLLIVQEAVSKPVLKLFVPSFNDTAGVCNVSVNCSIGDEWSASVCSVDSCRTTSSSLKKVNISISTANRSVVCTGSNQVSSSTESTKAICSEEFPDEHVVPQELSFNTLTVLVVSLCVLCFIIATVLVTCCSSKYKDHQEQRSLPQLIQSQRGGTLEAAPPLAPRASSSSEAEVSYENVDVLQQSQTSSDPVNSIYCLLQAPKPAAAAAADSSKDAPGHVTIQDATSSLQTVALDETSCVSEYSVVQRPKTVRSQHPQQAE